MPPLQGCLTDQLSCVAKMKAYCIDGGCLIVNYGLLSATNPLAFLVLDINEPIFPDKACRLLTITQESTPLWPPQKI